MAQGPGTIPTHFLFPCGVFAHREEHLVSTVLGSCVAICLWDSVRKVGGMNHYMLALWNGDGLPTPKYGNIAIEKLIQRLLERGCDQGRMVAKVFGGASVLGATRGSTTIGERNVEIAQQMLAQQKIPIIATDVGGLVGRRVVYNTGTSLVLVSRLLGAR